MYLDDLVTQALDGWNKKIKSNDKDSFCLHTFDVSSFEGLRDVSEDKPYQLEGEVDMKSTFLAPEKLKIIGFGPYEGTGNLSLYNEGFEFEGEVLTEPMIPISHEGILHQFMYPLVDMGSFRIGDLTRSHGHEERIFERQRLFDVNSRDPYKLGRCELRHLWVHPRIGNLISEMVGYGEFDLFHPVHEFEENIWCVDRFGDPHAIYNPTGRIQIAGFMTLFKD